MPFQTSLSRPFQFPAFERNMSVVFRLKMYRKQDALSKIDIQTQWFTKITTFTCNIIINIKTVVIIT